MNHFDDMYRSIVIYDCDTCLTSGTTSTGDLPPGWIEDTNGHHCPKCYPKEWTAA